MKAILDEMNIRAEEEQRRIDRITGYLIFAGSLLDSRSLGKLLTVMEAEGAEAALAGEKLRAVLKSIREQESQNQRRELMRSSLFGLLLIVLLLVGVFIVPAGAQDASDLATNTAEMVIGTLEATPLPVEVTAEPTAEVPPIVIENPSDGKLVDLVSQFLPYLAIIGVVGILGLSVVFHQAIVQIGAQAPSWAFEGGIAATRKVINDGIERAKTTEDPIDDMVWGEINKRLSSLEDETRKLRNEQTALMGTQGRFDAVRNTPPHSEQSGVG